MKHASSYVALFVVAAGCSTARYSTEPGGPSVVVPAHFAEGKGEPSGPPRPAAPPVAAPTTPTTPAASATAPERFEPLPTPATPSNLPDPTPLRLAEQVEYELELKDGKVRVVSVKAVKLPSPVVTPRVMGRYAVELTIGKELIERLRFDFPGTAADEPTVGSKKPLYAPLTLGERAIARVTLRVPQSPRVRRAVLVDRALSTAKELEWPLPDVPRAPAGAPKPSQP